MVYISGLYNGKCLDETLHSHYVSGSKVVYCPPCTAQFPPSRSPILESDKSNKCYLSELFYMENNSGYLRGMVAV